MTSRKTNNTRPLLFASIAALISATAAASPFDPSQPVGPVMQGLVQAIETATKSSAPLSAALVDTSNLPGELYNPPESRRRFSSIWANQGSTGAHAKSQLNSTQAWSAAFNNKKQWIELPIPSGSKAIGIATQGRANANQWVKRYIVSALLPDGSLLPLHGQNALAGNSNRNELVTHTFNAPQQATAIRITPTAWHRHISLRAALLTETESCSIQNLITNGSFEEHGPLNRNNWGTFAQIPGWTASTGHIELQQGNVGGLSAAQGQSKLELDAHHNSTVYTDVATNTGQNYQLAFAYSPRDTRTNTDTNDVEVWWDGEKIKTLSGHQRQWQLIKIQLHASSQSTRLEFRGAGTSDSIGGYIDSVTLKPDDNLLSNGSFESHAPINNGSWSTFDVIPGWQATVGQIELQLGRTGGIHALDGEAKLELDAHRNSAVITTLDTDANARYTVSFAYSPRVNSHGTSTNNAEVWWDNTKIATLKGNKPTWRNYTIPVTAANAQSQITFKATGHSDGLGALIDKVAVRPTANHIVNGSFEQHGAFNQQNWGTFAQIPGWTSDAGDIEIQRGNTSGIRALAGRDKLELDAHGNSSISTQISTTAGKHYQLRLAYSPRVRTAGTDTNDVEIRWNGQLIDTLSGDTQGWSIHSYSVTATAAQSELSLTAGGNSDSLGGLIDGVSLLAEGCDTTQPNKLSAVFDTPTDGQQLKQSAPTVVIDITGTDNPSTLVELNVDGQSTTVSCVADQLVTARLHCDTPNPLTDGDHSISATVSDAAGTTGTTSTINFSIDTVPPAIHWHQPLDGAYLNEQPIVVAGTLMPAQDSLTLNGNPLTLDAQGNFDTSLTLPEGTHTLVLSAQDPAANNQTVTRTIIIDRSAPTLPVTSLINFDEAPEGKIQLTGAAGSVEANTWVEITNTRTGESIRVQADANGAFTAALTGELGDQFTLTASDSANNTSPILEHTYSGNLPPDPATVAPPLPTTAITPPWEQWNFLHTGSNPIQREVAPNTFVDEHVALLRGKVLDMAGEPLPGARITIKDHPEYGYTLSRLDGMWDMLINGGGSNVVDYTLDGYLHIQRRLDPNWLETQYAEDVVMTPLDDQVTAIDTSDLSKPFHVATGAHVTDRFGERKLHMLFPAGTQAHYKRADGTQVDLDNFHVRATEYTVGDLGPNAMPGELPPASMYTYAMELTVDEASDAVFTEGKKVWFDNAVTVYLDDFVGVPAGTIVPLGYYNAEGATWETENDGRVVKILGIENGSAKLDIAGQGIAATRAELSAEGITDAELLEIAKIYSAGDSFWRISVKHFSPYDCNYWSRNSRPGPGGDAFNGGDKKKTSCEAADCDQCGCVIGALDQTLEEEIPVSGTPFRLAYNSERSAASLEGKRSITIDITDDTPPEMVFAAELDVLVGGKLIRRSWPGLNGGNKNISHTETWDGTDVFGRAIAGSQRATITLKYLYVPTPTLGTTGSPGGSFGGAGSGGGVSSTAMRDGIPTLIMSQTWNTTLAGATELVVESAALGGWTLDNHHAYELAGKKLAKGNGNYRTINSGSSSLNIPGDTDVVNPIFTRAELVAKNGEQLVSDLFYLNFYSRYAPDGTLYMASFYKLWKITPDGTIEKIAGENYPNNVYKGDGGHVSAAGFAAISDLEVSSNGDIYLTDNPNDIKVPPTIRKISATTGIIDTIDLSSVGKTGYSGNITSTRDGDLLLCVPFYLEGQRVIAKITPSENILVAVAATGSSQSGNFSGLNRPDCYAAGNDSLVFWSDSGTKRIIRLDTVSGEQSVVAGEGTTTAFESYNGMPATELKFTSTIDATVVDNSGGIYFTHKFGRRIYYISPNGYVYHAAGKYPAGSGAPTQIANAAAQQAVIGRIFDMSIAPTGNLRFVQDGYGVSELDSYLASFANADSEVLFDVPDSNSDELYRFNLQGQHIETVSQSTGILVSRNHYDETSNELIAIEDRFARKTTIERTSENRIVITSPDGQSTTLNLNGAGQLSSVENGAEQRWAMSYKTGGLLQTFERPNSAVNTFDYEPDGRLKSDLDPAGGGWSLTRTEQDNGKTVTMTTGENRVHTYTQSTDDITNTTTYVTTQPTGAATKKEYTFDASVITTMATGTVSRSRPQSDPLYGLIAPLQNTTTTYPSGLTVQTSETRTVTQDDSTEEVLKIEVSSTVNARTDKTTVDRTAMTVQRRTAGGRTLQLQLNDKNLPVEIAPNGIATSTLTYRADGRIAQQKQGTDLEERISSYSYFSDGPQKGFLESITDPLNRTVTFKRDAIGRATEQTLPDGRTVGFSFDANGNLETLTPPGRSAHVFHYDDRDLRQQDQPPALATGHTLTQYSYNLDKQLIQVLRPDQQIIQLNYGAATGLMNDMQTPRGGFVYNYNPTTAQISSVNTPEGETLTYRYDGELPIGESWTGVISGDVDFQLNNDLVPDSITVNNSDPVSYDYDNDLLLKAAGDLIITRSHAAGLITRTTLGARTTAQDYNDFGELERLSANSLGFNNVYTRDKLGRIGTRTETLDGRTVVYGYTYDLVGRLEVVTADGVETERYTYDANSNRLTADINGTSTTATVDAQDRLLAYGNTGYDYTLNGELKSKTTGGVITTFDYDVFGNLLKATLPGDVTIDYVVDAQHRRIGKKVNGTLTQGFLYQDQLNPIAELDGDNNVISRFVYGTRPNVPDYLIKDGKNYRIIADHLGSPRLVVDVETGAVIQRMDFDTFGNITLDTNPGFQPFGFAGGIYDHHTQLTRFGARDYDASVGRWTAKDPIGFAGGDVNLYGYVGVDPVNFVDPSGLVRPRRPEPGRAPPNPTWSQRPLHEMIGNLDDHRLTPAECRDGYCIPVPNPVPQRPKDVRDMAETRGYINEGGQCKPPSTTIWPVASSVN